MQENSDPHKQNPVDGLSVTRRLVPPSILQNIRLGQKLVHVEAYSIFLKYWSMVYNNALLIHIQTVAYISWCTLPRHCCHQFAKILLKGPLLVLGESYPDVFTMSHINHRLYTLPPNFMDF